MAAYVQQCSVSILGQTGQPFREANESNDRTIRLPYESEYKIRLKNKNSVRCSVQVLVDGMDIAPGRRFIVPANQTVDLERFVQDGDLQKGNRFKFVNALKGAQTGEIQDPHSPDLGLIEVRFYKEIVSPLIYPSYIPYIYSGAISGSYNFTTTANSMGNEASLKGMSNNFMATNHVGSNTGPIACAASGGTTAGCMTSDCAQPLAESSIKSDSGGTAMGRESNQQFGEYYGNFLTESTPITITIRLKGLKQAIVQPTPPVSPNNFIILDQAGNLLGQVMQVEMKLNTEKNFMEIQLTRQVPGSTHVYTESSVVAYINQEPHRYDPKIQVTVIKLATQVTDLTGLAFAKA